MCALTARHFDEFILDDLFFFNTESESDIAAKGKQTWDQFRLQTIDEVSRGLILKPAKEANPKVHVIIRFPNFYPSFQGMGFDLEHQPQIFPVGGGGGALGVADTAHDLRLFPNNARENLLTGATLAGEPPAGGRWGWFGPRGPGGASETQLVSYELHIEPHSLAALRPCTAAQGRRGPNYK